MAKTSNGTRKAYPWKEVREVGALERSSHDLIVRVMRHDETGAFAVDVRTWMVSDNEAGGFWTQRGIMLSPEELSDIVTMFNTADEALKSVSVHPSGRRPRAKKGEPATATGNGNGKGASTKAELKKKLDAYADRLYDKLADETREDLLNRLSDDELDEVKASVFERDGKRYVPNADLIDAIVANAVAKVKARELKKLAA